MIKNLTNRKPYPLPRPNVGDYILIKSKKWYDDNKNDDGSITFGPNHFVFAQRMSRCCGRWCKVVDVKTDYDEPNGWYCKVDNITSVFTENMIQEINKNI